MWKGAKIEVTPWSGKATSDVSSAIDAIDPEVASFLSTFPPDQLVLIGLLMSKIEKTDFCPVDGLKGGCWLWKATIRSQRGYGAFTVSKRSIMPAHRTVYRILRGPIRDGLVLDHLCRVRSCVNPDHLEPVTARENIRRGNGVCGVNIRMEICKNGHQFDEVRRDGKRGCSICRRERLRRWRAKQKGIQNA